MNLTLRFKCLWEGHRFSSYRRDIQSNTKKRSCMKCGKRESLPLTERELQQATKLARKAAEDRRAPPREPDTVPDWKR